MLHRIKVSIEKIQVIKDRKLKPLSNLFLVMIKQKIPSTNALAK